LASLWLPLAGTLLALTAVGPHLVFDDYVLALIARGEPAILGLKQGRFDLFTFTTGIVSENHSLIDHGVMLPWWSDGALEIAFFRPLSSLFHRLDYLLWPAAPKLMYLHSLAWLALTLGVVARCYRRLESSPLFAGLATALLALDDTHAGVVAWLSNRNALLATTFSVLALTAHDRARRDGHRVSALLAPLYFLLALAAGEFGLAALAYLVAHALCLDPAPPRRRLRGLAPYGMVLTLWIFVYASSGAAVRGSGGYLSPLAEPKLFLSHFPARAECLLAAVVGPLPSDPLFLGRPQQAALWLTLAGVVLGVTGYALLPILRRDRVARFWFTGAVLSVVPITASVPGDRLLLLVSVGGMGLLARIILPLFEGKSAVTGVRRALALAFAGWHLGCAPLLLPLRAGQMQLVASALERANSGWSALANLSERTVVIVNAPIDLFASYLQLERAWKRAPSPRHLYWLTSAGSELRVTRSGARSLSVERENGFLSTPLEQHYRSRVDTLPPSTQVELSRMSVEVERVTLDGRPLSVAFRFREPLESSSYQFLAWQGDRYLPFALPEIGRSVRFPAQDLGKLLLRTALEPN
jgi:hypothetical protein